MNNYFTLNHKYLSHPQTEFTYKDDFMLKLIAFQWLIVTTVGLLLYNDFWFGFLSGAVLFFITYIANKNFSNTQVLRNINALVLLTFAVIMIQQSGGRIEMHFYIFVLLSFLILYKDTIPMSVGAAYIILHHLIFNYLQEYNVTFFDTPIIVFNYGCGLDIVLLHGAFVVFEWYVLGQIISHMQRDSLDLINSKNALDSVNTNLESMVKIRTEELVKAKKEADEANKMKSEFLANMSHEIRTPMNAIMGFTDLLQSSEQDSVSKNYVQSIQDSSKILLTLINDILDLSKVEAGKIEINEEPIDLNVLVSDLKSVFTLKCQSKNLELLFDIDSDLPHSLLIDEVRLRQILFNLMSNAIKFTYEGYVKVSLKKEESYKDDEVNLILSVEDSGIGVSEKDRESIFEAFTQQRHQSTKLYGGTGLGLTIVTKLLALMDGSIELQSKENEGSTFIISLKHVKISDEKSVNNLISQAKREVTFNSGKVLIVDDIDLNRKLLQEYLKTTPLEVVEAITGEEAIEKIKGENFDVILMDIKMPVMDGYEASNIIKKMKEELPIIALTASVIHFHRDSRNNIFDDFLTKPIEREALFSSLCTYLDCNVKIVGDVSEEKNKVINLNQIGCESLENSLNIAKNSGDIYDAESFAKELQECSIDVNAHKIADKLLDAVDSFDVEASLKLLALFKVN